MTKQNKQLETTGIIQVLPDNLINKIAAGEVIDRPASAVKELVENSLDAGADEITVLVKEGGRALIQVIDNGCGMSEEDAIMSFQRHATSKIRSFQDIEIVRTLGFRGEALASIASVSRMEIKTVPQDHIEGTLINIEGGVVNKMEATGGNPGTSIAIKNIFFNTPARRKFLRAASTEYRQILNVMNRFTLSYPNVEFNMFHEDKEVFSYKKTEHSQRMAEVLGRQIGENLLPVDEENALFKITGFLGNLDILRRSRSEQYFFVNNRYINDRTLSAAVISGYGETLPKGNFPIYALFFEIDPERIDVNVHPTKSEIKFADQQMLFSLVRGAVSRALRSDTIIPDGSQPQKQDLRRIRHRFQGSLADEMKSFSESQTQLDFDAAAKHKVSTDDQPSQLPTSSTPFPIQTARQDENDSPRHDQKTMLWQLHHKYIVSQIKSGLVLVDQHAAHERVLYEKVKKSFSTQHSNSQHLLFPHTLDLSAEDFQHLMDILPFLEKMGFIIKGFGSRTVVVEGVPTGMRIGSEEKILLEILDEYKLKLGTEVDMQERVAKSVACRGAIMTGERLTHDAMSGLVDQLFACEQPYFCPHGRPTMLTISIEELDNRFERT